MSKQMRKLDYVRNYSLEFILSPTDELFWLLCNKNVNSDRKSTIDKHRKSKEHLLMLEKLEENTNASKQTFLFTNKDKQLELLVKAFISAEIPLYKLRILNLRIYLNL